MKKRFPKLVSYNDLAYMLQAMPNPQAEYKLLSKFIVEYPRFHVGSSLLPDLIRLYQWLHREMAHCVTKKTASRLTLAKIKKQLAEKTPEKSKEFFALHESVLGIPGTLYIHIIIIWAAIINDILIFVLFSGT